MLNFIYRLILSVKINYKSFVVPMYILVILLSIATVYIVHFNSVFENRYKKLLEEHADLVQKKKELQMQMSQVLNPEKIYVRAIENGFHIITKKDFIQE